MTMTEDELKDAAKRLNNVLLEIIESWSRATTELNMIQAKYPELDIWAKFHKYKKED